MSFKARLLLVLALGGVGAVITYVAFGRASDEDAPQVSHVATAADYGGGTTLTEPAQCTSYLVTPLAGNTDVRIRVTPDPHAPMLGTLPSGAVVGSREIREGYVHLAQPQLGWIALEELRQHCP